MTIHTCLCGYRKVDGGYIWENEYETLYAYACPKCGTMKIERD